MDIKDANLVFFYKNFSKVSHIGLGVSAQLASKYLINTYGLHSRVCGVSNVADIRAVIDKAEADDFPITHAVISAPWIETTDVAAMLRDYPWTQFAMNLHSNLGFLQADGNGARIFRENLLLEQGTSNFKVAANCATMCTWVQETYRSPCLYLPNLYYLDKMPDPTRPGWAQTGGTLRIGIFGAARAQKNIVTAVGAAMQIAARLKAQTEIWMSTNREDDQAARMIMNAVRALTNNVPGVALVALPWATWPEFRKYAGNMHLLIQVSYTESFNIVTCDGIAEGVSSIVSSAIDWCPPQWFADPDDAQDVATVGIGLLGNPTAPRMGMAALQKTNSLGALAWEEYLTGTRP